MHRESSNSINMSAVSNKNMLTQNFRIAFSISIHMGKIPSGTAFTQTIAPIAAVISEDYMFTAWNQCNSRLVMKLKHNAHHCLD